MQKQQNYVGEIIGVENLKEHSRSYNFSYEVDSMHSLLARR